MKFIRNLKGTCSWRFIVVFAFLITGVNAQESNLSGGWIMNERGSWQGLVTTESAELVLAKFDRSVDDPSMRCIAPGLIRATESQAPLEIVEQDHQILILYEAFNVLRRVHMDGRIAPEWMPLSPVGYSMGNWQGDELIVETTHLTPHLFNDDGLPFSGHPEGKTIERYRLLNNRLELEFTVVDPINFQRPVTRTHTFNRVPDATLLHFHCDPLEATGWRIPVTGDSLRDLLRWLELRPAIPTIPH
ncbi:MAG: hypothetical protein CMM56_08705 [Rhodospirillaceae bacterium]|nr:hypothetical protein [Rhodospirillaceae bacterium]